MDQSICQQCQQVCNDAYNRIIRDSCGHYKCRLCLLQEANQCLACSEQDTSPNDPFPETYENVKPNYAPEPLDYEIDTKTYNRIGSVNFVYSESSRGDLLEQNTVKHISNGYVLHHENFTIDNDASEVIYKSVPTDLSKKVSCSTIADSLPKKIENVTNTVNKDDSDNSDENIAKLQSQTSFKDTENISVNQLCCSKCDIIFNTAIEYEEHASLHIKKKFTCDTCNAKFDKKSKLIRHIYTHTKIKLFQCKLCTAKFSNSSSLKKHGLIHSDLKPYPCKYCSMTFRDSSNLRKHQSMHLGAKFLCPECGKDFQRKSYLKSHLRIHNPIKLWTCSRCEKEFSSKRNKDRHELTHNKKYHYCTFCNSNFIRRDNLERHIRNSHNDSNPVNCLNNSSNVIERNETNKADNHNDNSNLRINSMVSKKTEKVEGSKNISDLYALDKSELCNKNCLLHIVQNKKDSVVQINNMHLNLSNEVSTVDFSDNCNVENKTDENCKRQTWNAILEANNKRQSVIFKSETQSKPVETATEIQCSIPNSKISDYNNEINFNKEVKTLGSSPLLLNLIKDDGETERVDLLNSSRRSKETISVMEMYKKMFTLENNDISMLNNSLVDEVDQFDPKSKLIFYKNSERIDKETHYIHKKVNYDLQKDYLQKFAQSTSQKDDEFDDAKASWYIFQLSKKKITDCADAFKKCSPAAIELYKKILIPKYKSDGDMKDSMDDEINELQAKLIDGEIDTNQLKEGLHLQLFDDIINGRHILYRKFSEISSDEATSQIETDLSQNRDVSDVHTHTSNDIHWRRRLANHSSLNEN